MVKFSSRNGLLERQIDFAVRSSMTVKTVLNYLLADRGLRINRSEVVVRNDRNVKVDLNKQLIELSPNNRPIELFLEPN